MYKFPVMNYMTTHLIILETVATNGSELCFLPVLFIWSLLHRQSEQSRCMRASRMTAMCFMRRMETRGITHIEQNGIWSSSWELPWPVIDPQLDQEIFETDYRSVKWKTQMTGIDAIGCIWNLKVASDFMDVFRARLVKWPSLRSPHALFSEGPWWCLPPRSSTQIFNDFASALPAESSMFCSGHSSSLWYPSFSFLHHSRWLFTSIGVSLPTRVSCICSSQSCYGLLRIDHELLCSVQGLHFQCYFWPWDRKINNHMAVPFSTYASNFGPAISFNVLKSETALSGKKLRYGVP